MLTDVKDNRDSILKDPYQKTKQNLMLKVVIKYNIGIFQLFCFYPRCVITPLLLLFHISLTRCSLIKSKSYLLTAHTFVPLLYY
jgi:hypothetical protein